MCDNEEVGALGIHLILLANIICSYSEGSYPNAEHAGFQPLMDDIHFPNTSIISVTQPVTLFFMKSLKYHLNSSLSGTFQCS